MGVEVRVMAKKTEVTVEGKTFPVRFERRRYGTGASSRTFTWVEAYVGGSWVSLGDPWPCITPARKEIEAAIAGRMESGK